MASEVKAHDEPIRVAVHVVVVCMQLHPDAEVRAILAAPMDEWIVGDAETNPVGELTVVGILKIPALDDVIQRGMIVPNVDSSQAQVSLYSIALAGSSMIT